MTAPCAHAPCVDPAPLRMAELARGDAPPCFWFVPLCARHAEHLADATGLTLLPEGCEGEAR